MRPKFQFTPPAGKKQMKMVSPGLVIPPDNTTVSGADKAERPKFLGTYGGLRVIVI